MSWFSFRRIALQNWGLKILSLLIAIFMWMFVVAEKSSEMSVSVPLELSGLESEMVVVSDVPSVVRVRLNGPRTLIASIKPKSLVYSLDLEGIQHGISSFEVLPSRLDLPRGVEVTHLSPSVITLEADRKDRKQMTVKVRIKGRPAEGFEIGETSVEPQVVEVEGPSRTIRLHSEIPTESVDVTGLEGSVTQPVGLVFPDPNMRLVDDRNVRVEVEVLEVFAEREFLGIPVEVKGERWMAKPPKTNVKVSGSLRILSKLTGKDLVVGVAPVGDSPPLGAVPLIVTLPEGVELVTIVPDGVLIRTADAARE